MLNRLTDINKNIEITIKVLKLFWIFAGYPPNLRHVCHVRPARPAENRERMSELRSILPPEFF